MSAIERAWRKAVASVTGSDVTEKYAHYRGRENDFIREELGIRLWKKQRSAVEHLFRDHFVSERSCRKSGKTHELGAIVVTFIATAPSIVVAIAPTERQVKDLLWSEIREIYATHGNKLPGKCDTMQVRIGPKHYAIGFSTDRPARIMGFHAKPVRPMDDPDRDLTEEEMKEIMRAVTQDVAAAGVRLLFVFDEAQGIEQKLFDAVQGSLSGPNVYAFLAGNPDLDEAEQHEFALSQQPGSKYHRIKVAARPSDDALEADEEYDHVPNWLMPEEWIGERLREWGEGSALYQSHVLGRFAGKHSEHQLISSTLLTSALANKVNAAVGVHMGCDIAASERGDESVATLWDHGVKVAVYTWREPELMKTVEIVQALRVEWGKEGEPIPGRNVHIDDIGLGSGVGSRLHQLGVYVDRVDFSEKPVGDWPALNGELQFKNRRAELHWTLRRALQEGLAQIPRTLHGQPCESWREAQWPEYDHEMTAQGTMITIRKKEGIIQRFGRSPDHFDADLYAWSRTGGGPQVIRR